MIFKELHETLPDNYSVCEKQLLKLFNNLKNDTVLLKKHDYIFFDQEEEEIIESVETGTTLGDYNYIAHHPDFREDKKKNTKPRIVFDASAKESGPSSNEVLHKWPQLTPWIFNMLFKTTLDCFYVVDVRGGESNLYKALNLLKKLKLRFVERYFHLHK